MIKTLSELLQALRTTEAQILAAQDIKHGPTIGDMYEGLTRDILTRAIPPELGLQVVAGFIEGLDGNKSNQADVLLVRGAGREIPYTGKYIWPIQDVLAIFEVKKTLYGEDLKDSFAKMHKVMDLHREFAASGGYAGKAINFAHKNFAMLTGFHPRVDDVDHLPMPLPLIHHWLELEQLAPVRIVLGYEGYVNEKGLRSGIGELMDKQGDGIDRGFLFYPTLIICREFSVVKSNGLPYYYPLDHHTSWWHTMMSNAENPTKILLEQIWTKINVEMEISLPMDDTLQQEIFSPFLRQKFVQRELDGVMRSGFAEDRFDHLPSNAPHTPSEWVPHDAEIVESVILMRASASGSVSIDDHGLQSFARKEGTSAEDAVREMVRKRILGWTDASERVARPIATSYATVFTPTGKTVVSEQSSLLSLWALEQIPSRGPNKE